MHSELYKVTGFLSAQLELCVLLKLHPFETRKKSEFQMGVFPSYQWMQFQQHMHI